jgi:hypothetical protein
LSLLVEEHAMPQPPQLFVSVPVLTQVPSQQVSSARQQWILPDELMQHVSPVPQHCVSPAEFVQMTPPQGQTLQTLLQQYWPLGQQVPPQSVSPA